ncbi:MAG TPA: thiamine pyrophosphate-requiring protein [Acidimicrobiales bacterium]|nr:thiamine pyrophosphate-requiring protein [Acidimicrobiales bacterium]
MTRVSRTAGSEWTTAEQILALLAQHGVEFLFLNPGTDTAPFQEAMTSLPARGVRIPRVVPCSHEAVALAAAHGYWKVTGRPQCVVVHVDVGTQNLGAMVHDAFRDRAGVVLIAGKAPYGEDPDVPGGRSNPIHWHQDVPDQAGIVRGYAKWSMEITRPDVVARCVGRAVQIATAPVAGPTYLTVSRDVLMEPAVVREDEAAGYAVPAPPPVGTDELRRISGLVAGAERPLVLTARVGRQPRAVAALARLADLVGLRVGGRPEALNIPWSHPLHLRSPEATQRAVAEADVILVVECDVPWIPRRVRPAADARVVHIDPDPVKADMPLWSFPAELAVMADGATALEQLVGALAAMSAEDPELAVRWSTRREAVLGAAGSNGNRQKAAVTEARGMAMPTPAAAVAALSELLSPEDIVLEEAVTNAAVVHEHLERSTPGTFLEAGGPGLGWALGGAVGVKLARPGRVVAAIVGDGSFQFGVPTAALALAAEADTPFLTVILDNEGYRASRLPVLELFPDGAAAAAGSVAGTRFARPPHFAGVAEACHAYGEQVTTTAELSGAFKRGLAAVAEGRSAVIDVVVGGQ